MTNRWNPIVIGLIGLLAIIVFFKNAWVAEDAYIIFRSLEQLFAGRGPIWNPHERVQVYTSPLWYWVLAGARLLTPDLYLGTIAMSLLAFVGMLVALYKTVQTPINFAIVIGLLLCSNGFFDYTSSGLENVLAYLLIAIYMGFYIAIADREPSRAQIVKLLLIAGLTICVRHDIALLLLPMTLFVIKRHASLFSRRQWAGVLTLALLPFLSWSLFSLVYYGFPFPNTAYAKMNTDISHYLLFVQGLCCMSSSFQHDCITLFMVICAALLVFDKTAKPEVRVAGYGIFATLLYFVWVGGDFMQGRFFSYAYLVSVIVLLRALEQSNQRVNRYLMLGLILLFGVFYPHTPLNSSPNYEETSVRMGVADERGFYFSNLSMTNYLRLKREGSNRFPDHKWAVEGRNIRNQATMVSVRDNIGLFGYYAGLDHKIIDPLALSEPMLARLPVNDDWRVGHYRRLLPRGFLATVETGIPQIEDPKLNEFYRHLTVVTESQDLLAPRRLKEILLFNIGAYNHLLPREASSRQR